MSEISRSIKERRKCNLVLPENAVWKRNRCGYDRRGMNIKLLDTHLVPWEVKYTTFMDSLRRIFPQFDPEHYLSEDINHHNSHLRASISRKHPFTLIVEIKAIK